MIDFRERNNLQVPDDIEDELPFMDTKAPKA